MVPIFLIAQFFGVTNTRFSVIIVASALGMPFPVWLLKGYFDTIPVTLEEAALVDGCTRVAALARIILPLSAPGLLSVFMVTFILGWSQFVVPLVLITDTNLLPATVGIFRLMDEMQVRWNLVMAATLVTVVPPIIVYFFAQKHIVGGLTAGGVKQ